MPPYGAAYDGRVFRLDFSLSERRAQSCFDTGMGSPHIFDTKASASKGAKTNPRDPSPVNSHRPSFNKLIKGKVSAVVTRTLAREGFLDLTSVMPQKSLAPLKFC